MPSRISPSPRRTLSATTRPGETWRIAKTDRHAPQCSFSDQEIFEIIADIRRTPLTSRLSEVPLKKRASLHLNFYDGREDPKQWITSFMTAMRRQKYHIAGRTKRALLPSPRRTLARRRPNMVQQPPCRLHRQLRRSSSRFPKATPPFRTRRPRLLQNR
ncbi:unnamed protein product [Microthlaspi erraticum]|uniref:Uncharacterized protein n=1 Tax=Microthlaspi erraticum TaxID=1685480 RepID=A0A6D2J0V2_9BRAS|nr:unnamed protein product [Microthlaspi erraticum]